MKNRQLQIKLKTLIDELRQKETFDRLDCLAQFIESIPTDDIGIPSPRVQQDIPFGTKQIDDIEVAESIPIDDICIPSPGVQQDILLGKKQTDDIKVAESMPIDDIGIPSPWVEQDIPIVKKQIGDIDVQIEDHTKVISIHTE